MPIGHSRNSLRALWHARSVKAGCNRNAHTEANTNMFQLESVELLHWMHYYGDWNALCDAAGYAPWPSVGLSKPTVRTIRGIDDSTRTSFSIAICYAFGCCWQLPFIANDGKQTMVFSDNLWSAYYSICSTTHWRRRLWWLWRNSEDVGNDTFLGNVRCKFRMGIVEQFDGEEGAFDRNVEVETRNVIMKVRNINID